MAQGRALRWNPDSATGGMTLGSITVIICTRQIIIPASWGCWEDSTRWGYRAPDMKRQSTGMGITKTTKKQVQSGSVLCQG